MYERNPDDDDVVDAEARASVGEIQVIESVVSGKSRSLTEERYAASRGYDPESNLGSVSTGSFGEANSSGARYANTCASKLVTSPTPNMYAPASPTTAASTTSNTSLHLVTSFDRSNSSLTASFAP